MSETSRWTKFFPDQPQHINTPGVTTMSGPIVRTGATPEFWDNWDRIFGDKAKDAGEPKSKSTRAKKASAPKKAGKKAAKKAPAAKKKTAPAKKKAGKKKK
jgi:hypothetical protein